MKRLRKLINESFFNPVFHFLPLLAFMVIDDVWGLKDAWFSSLSITIFLFVYIFYVYRKILEWFVISISLYFFVAFSSTFFPFHRIPDALQKITPEFILLAIFSISLIFRNEIEKFINKRKSRLLPMSNNLNEMFRMIWILGSIILGYVITYALVSYSGARHLKLALEFVHSAYFFVLFFVVIYEMIRVTVIRIRLLREEWWPIVNEQGKLIGSIQSQASLMDEKKYIHPVVRVFIVDNNRIFLQKRCTDDRIAPDVWDTAISNHIRINETMENCINRTAEESYGIKTLKPLFLSNYIHETEFEYQYAFLFVACSLPGQEHNRQFIDHAKWWTVGQIEENIASGIFSENFLSELEVVKRSGLIGLSDCMCECQLKDLVNKKFDVNTI